jgi:hypothetical protein
MRQIGVRDGARIIGNLGICGLEVCCKKFLTSFEPISIKMAKKQELVLNTGKLSGSCGRLMCCLGYEYSDSIPEETAFSEAEIPAPEEGESVELVVASSDVPGDTAETPQPLQSAGSEPSRDSSPPSRQPENQEQKEKRRRWHPKKRRKKPFTK